jgi:small-conductance mechanosensitive channel
LGTIPAGNLLHRLVLLMLSVVALAGFFWLSRQLAHGDGVLGARWNRMASTGARFSIAAFALAILANVFGAVPLASLLEHGTLAAFFWAILFWAGAQVLKGMVATELKTSGAHALMMVRFHSDTIRHFADQTITILAAVLWVVTTLDAFSIREQTATWIRAAIEAEFTVIGNVTIVPINFVVFPLVIWLSFKLSRVLRFALETDVLPRVELPRGVPDAVSKGTHYAALITGIVVASLAAKIPLDRLTIIVGALGVGIGFGLQNIVNNFVSGLILLFERPIQVGDRIQFGTYAGMVTEIGIRASTVRTWQGADVIVPNANLVSSEVTNWVRTSQQRRIEIPIGVAYGTDPEVVLELLRGVAEAHEQVLDDPGPYAIFKGFGDSALDFELRCWTTEDWVRVGSDITVGISRALAEADITIPFPQRDIHLRTEPEKASPVVPQTRQPDPPDEDPGDRDSTHGA